LANLNNRRIVRETAIKKNNILPFWTNFKFDWNSGDDDNDYDNDSNNNDHNSNNNNKFFLKPIIALFAEGNTVQLLP